MSGAQGHTVLTRLCGAAMGLLGFSASLIIGLAVDNPFIVVVLRSLWVMALFFLVGSVLSVLGQKVVQEHFETTKEELRARQKKQPGQEDGSTELEPEITDQQQEAPVADEAGQPVGSR